MKKFKVFLTGYDNSEWHSTTKEMIVEAKDLDEAKEIAHKWCEDNSEMWSYDWYIEHIQEENN